MIAKRLPSDESSNVHNGEPILSSTVQNFIGEFIERLVGEGLRDGYVGTPLVDLGLDSIGAVDLSIAIEKEYDVVVDPADIRPDMTVVDLGECVVEAAVELQ